MHASTNSPCPTDVYSPLTHDTAVSIHHSRDLSSLRGAFQTEQNLLLFVKEGSMTLLHGNSRHTIEKNQLAFIRKGIQLEYICGDHPVIWVSFVLTAELIISFTKQNKFDTCLNNDTVNVMIADTDESWMLYIASLKPYIQEGAIAETLQRIKMTELMFCLSVSNPSILGQLLDVRENYRPDISQIVEENMLNSVTLDQLARMAGRSVSSFRRDFLSIYNMPPSRWIRLKRLEKAQQMLSATNMSVTSICYELGFESIAHFSRVFKSRFGYPPTEQRLNSFTA